MRPVCLANVGFIATSATSASGLTALVVKEILLKWHENHQPEEIQGEETIEKMMEANEHKMGERLIRFFTSEEVFALYVECGMKRKISTSLTSNHETIQLSITMPLPPSDLLQKNWFS